MSDDLNIGEALADIQDSLSKIKTAVRCDEEKTKARWLKDILNPPTVAILIAVLGGPVVTQQLLGGQAIPTSFEEAGSLLDQHLEAKEPEVVEEKKEPAPKPEPEVVEVKKEEPKPAPAIPAPVPE